MVDTKFSDLTEKITPESNDIIAITDINGGIVSKKIQLGNLPSSNPFDQSLDTTDTPSFTGLGLTGDLDMNDNDMSEIATAGFNGVNNLGSQTTSFNVPFDTDQSIAATLTANTMTATLQTPLQNDATRTFYITNGGLATLTWAAASGTVKWVGGSAPTLTSSGLDIVTFKWNGTDWHGVASLDFS